MTTNGHTAFNWKVAGFAGEGIMTTGLLFSKTCARQGLHIFDYTEYPSLIRGGHNTYQVYADSQSATAQSWSVDVLVALNKNALEFHRDELTDQSIVLFDAKDDKIDLDSLHLPCRHLDLPMVQLAIDSGGERLMGNNVALGASIYLLGLDFALLEAVIADVFGKKGQEVVTLNRNAARAGYEYAQKHTDPLHTIPQLPSHDALTLTGNEALGLGAIAGGLKLYVAYPMTPSSSILHYLAKVAPQGNFVVKHAEDEISTINMALGAAFTGARVAVGTSGGGFCYMTEALGLSGVAEIPLVVFEVMRPGPALGMPTWTAQGDLQFVINASQDEFPRFVLAPGNAQEAFELTRQAFDLAEKYQTLAIVISDKYLSESRHTMPPLDTTFTNTRHGVASNPQPDDSGFYPRYRDTDSGLTPRSLPGMPAGTYVANSYEHDIYGLATEEGPVRVQQVDKRFKKFAAMITEVPEQHYDTQPNAAITLISFGSSLGPITSARQLLHQQGIATNHLHLTWLWPFPASQVTQVIQAAGQVVVVEGNYQGQLRRLIAQETGQQIDHNLTRYDGRPFYPTDIIDFIKGLHD